MPKTADRLRKQVGKITPVVNEIRKHSMRAEEILTSLEDREARQKRRSAARAKESVSSPAIADELARRSEGN